MCAAIHPLELAVPLAAR